jgi:probable F420-dependent oxidoreductase
MEFGLLLPTDTADLDGDAVREYAQTAEGLGFESLWVGDHVAVPRGAQSRYPYVTEMAATAAGPGEAPPTEDTEPRTPALPDPLGLLHFAAACTRRVKLGTTVLILPMRNPVLTAHSVANLDVLSGGRVILGVGVGWNREEFATLNASFEQRGARTDEYLEIVRRLWTLDDATYGGRYYSIGEVNLRPKPVQKPHPPFWFGGNEEPALRRTVRFDGTWHFGFIGSDQIRPRVARLRQLAESAGKDPASFPITGLRIDLMGRTPEDARNEVRALDDVGVSHVVAGMPLQLPAFYRTMEVFAQEVMRASRGG